MISLCRMLLIFRMTQKKYGQSHVLLTTAAANIPVKRVVRRPWLTTETMDIIDQKKEARLKSNHDEWKRLKGVYKARSKVDLVLFTGN